ncbi:rieske (2Fe-2S) domain protein [Luminiphilus syltensis NOR5-1B]|uniref:Rieske (2Fe-2S) domain protein n=1 Tax=Luminiphilus syltensis NOR5-1B TaxID=565045 RepID=B8KS34_9GAMM|nr:SRPBCC family protein [Luminiphilus syltensis]EED34628.1 rieske (2Fe-2S) domain protein [Luminiphilus syltensis NOR5-1B]
MTAIDTEQLRTLMDMESQRNRPPSGFPSLPPVPSRRYSDPAFYEQEQQQVFRRSWLLAAHIDELPEPGSFLRWDIAEPPVVLVHASDGTIHALINRCSHRGAPVVMPATGSRPRLTCPYHGWSYAHDGELIAIASDRDFGAIDKANLGLPALRCERLGALIFVNFDSQAPSLEASLGSLIDEWAEFDLQNCRLSRRDRFTIKSNWKIAMEANMEVYHVPMVHRKTVAAALDANRNVNTFYPGGHGRMVAPIPQSHQGGAWKTSWPEIKSAGEIARTCTLSYNVFPNLVMPLNQYVVPPIQFWPNGTDECIVETWTLAPDWRNHRESGPDMWTENNGEKPSLVLREDIEMSEAIQKAMADTGERGIPLSYQEARIYYWHQWADALIGLDNIEPALRVADVIGNEWVHPNEPRLA